MEADRDLRVLVLEKAPEIGNHILSGAVIEPRALNELFPDWKERGAPLNVPVTEDHFNWLRSDSSSFRFPITPPQMQNHGNYIASLGNLCVWLSQQAEELGVEIYPDNPVREGVYNPDGSLKGVATCDKGLDRNGKPKSTFTRGFETVSYTHLTLPTNREV
eukprot:TRINITY_DN6938_c0_g1_i2.p1 TRINITY_DN6938_c0_g1~~TRINITY_DN6938_c0_g1_i2.p1  ORF type:complete len:161 (-),score=20.92 TRINITY_DN6938_c0_g1_i2:9-491(-)